MSEQDSTDGDTRENRGGRPRKDPEERRSLTHGLRLSPKEKEEMEQRAERAGLNLSEYIRRKALGKKVKPKVDEEAIRQIRSVGHNLNQVAQWANQRKKRPANPKKDAALEAEIREVVSQIKDAMRQLL